MLQRDDLAVEFVTLLNRVGRHADAVAILAGRRFHPWEGGEGLAAYRQRGLDAASVVGDLAASAGLVPAGGRLSAIELLQELGPCPERLDHLLGAPQA